MHVACHHHRAIHCDLFLFFIPFSYDFTYLLTESKSCTYMSHHVQVGDTIGMRLCFKPLGTCTNPPSSH